METKTHPSTEDYRTLVEEDAEDLYEHAPCGYISALPNGLIIKANQTFLTWMGYTRQEFVAIKRFQELLSVGGRIFYETHFAPLLRMQGFINEIQFELVNQAGAPLPVLVNSIQRKNAKGEALLNRITLFNNADRKKYERELMLARQKAEQAARAKADFLSMVSHEIRTPMNAILGIASLLRTTELSSQQQRYVRILQSSSENLLGLINHILDFSKIDAGKVTLEEKNFNLRQLVHGTLFALDIKEEKKLSVLAEIDESLPACLLGDPIKLGQILTNLVGNAIKFTEMGAVTVTLRARELNAEAVSIDFAVTDTGIGIAEDRLKNIFEEFTQASYDIGMKYGGTGLGLAISRKLVELHGGRLCVKSSLGKGSCFYFTLSLKIGREEEEDPEESARNLAHVQAIRGLKVLMAEDNSINVFMLSQFLRKWGIDFDVVGTGQQAIERVQENDYDLVLMDVRMPERDGYEATQAIRSLPGEKFRRLPIIALTASSRIDLKNRLEDVGFTDFLGKPYKPEELAAKLAQHHARQSPAPVASPPPSETPAPGAQKTTAPPRHLSLERVMRILGNDKQALGELSQLIIKSGEQYKQDFKTALETGNRESFEYLAHKIRPTMELLKAQPLSEALQQGHDCLAEATSTLPRVSAAIHAIHDELDAIIMELKEEVAKA